MSGVAISTSNLNIGEIKTQPNLVTLNKEVEKKEVPTLSLEGDSFKSSTKEAKTPLQKHVAFFDQNNDGVIHVSETYKGLRDLHLSKPLSALGAVFINAGLGSKTGEKFSDLTVNVKNIAGAKHDSDTDVFDEKGNFSAPKFEELFKKYDLDNDGALSKEEFLNFRNRNKESTAGAIGSKGEFDLLVTVAGEAKNETKVISKERMLDFYNGSLFYKIAGKEIPTEK